MSSATVPSAPVCRRTVLWLAGCAAAGAGLRWGTLPPPDKTTEDEWLPPGAVVVAENTKPEVPALTPQNWPALPPSQRLARLAAQLPQLTAEELEALLPLVAAESYETWLKITEYLNFRDTGLMLLFTRWLELDAAGMVAALKAPAWDGQWNVRILAVAMLTQREGTAALETVQRKWPAVAREVAFRVLQADLQQAEKLVPFIAPLRLALRESYGGAYTRLNWNHLYRRLLDELGPERTLRIAMQMEDDDLRQWAVEDTRRTDRERLVRVLRDLPASDWRDVELLQLLEPDMAELSISDPVRFQREYSALPAGKLRTGLTSHYARVLHRQDPVSAQAWARQLPGGEERHAAFLTLASACHDAEQWRQATALALESWRDYSPGETATALDLGGDSGPRELTGLMQDAVNRWMAAEPEPAAAWLRALPDAALRSRLAAALPQELQSRVAGLASAADVLAEACYRSYSHLEGPNSAAVEPVLRDFPEALRRPIWLTNTRNEGVYESHWNKASTEDRRFLSAAAVESRSKDNPQKGLDFFQAMSPEERSLGAWHAAGAAWVQKDEQAASEWMRALPPGPERDAAATALVEHLTKSGPGRDGEAAFAWAADMSGAVERAFYIENAARAWAMEDAAAARAAVAAAPLEEAKRAALLRELPEGGAR